MDINVDLLYLLAGLSVVWSTCSYKTCGIVQQTVQGPRVLY